MIFVNYISSDSILHKYNNYRKQHFLFASSIRYVDPESTCVLIKGVRKEDRFVEGLENVRKRKKLFTDPLVYVDNDCVLVNKIDWLFDKYDFDVGVIYRYNWETEMGYQDCLGGFLYFSQKRPDVEDMFLDKLIIRTKERFQEEFDNGIDPWYYDQLAINDIVGRPPKERTKKQYNYSLPYKPQLKEVDGVKILFLSANQWACPMTYYPPKKIYMYHYNHRIWPEINPYIESKGEKSDTL